MNQQQCKNFLRFRDKTNTFSQEELDNIYDNFNTDHDNLLKFNEFLNYSTNLALDDEAQFWNDLYNLGLSSDQEFYADTHDEEERPVEWNVKNYELPRKLLANEQIY